MKQKIIDLLKSTKREGIDKLIAYLEKSDYFVAPASTVFHSAYEGGLAYHSYKVYEKLKDLSIKNNLKFDDNDNSIIIIGLLHDICKTYMYKVDYRNKKNDMTGVWEKVPYYTIDEKMPIGVHGDKSVMILQQIGLKLTSEECYCIRYHMGAYEGEKSIKSLSNAIRKCDNILYVELADILATIEEEREKEI